MDIINQLCEEVLRKSNSNGVVIFLLDKEDQWSFASSTPSGKLYGLPDFLRFSAEFMESSQEDRGFTPDYSRN